VSGFDENGYHKPGTIGRGVHLGDPLTAQQIRELPDGAEIVITWDGGNGPWPARILVDSEGQRRAEGLYCDRLLDFDAPYRGELQRKPFHRVTLGWDDATRAWDTEHGARARMPDHIKAKWAQLRGTSTP
jgi:hypothetical protein